MKAYKKTTIQRIIAVLLNMAILLASLSISAYADDAIADEQEGVVSAQLSQMFSSSLDEDAIYRVIIWLNDINTDDEVCAATKSIPDFTESFQRLTESQRLTASDADELTRLISVKRSAMKDCYFAYTMDFASANLADHELIYRSAYIPAIIADLSCDRVMDISTAAEVSFIEYYDDTPIEDPFVTSNVSRTIPENYYSIADNIEYINADGYYDTWGTDGYGVNVGILDDGMPDLTENYFRNADITVHYPETGTVSEHATNVLKIAYRTACDANYFCTAYSDTGVSTTMVEELDWLISKNVDVINISLRIRQQQGGSYDSHNTYGAVAKVLDKYVALYDITIIKSSGNDGVTGVTSGGMAYNVITVGNFDRYNNCIASSSSYNNSSSLLAYKPDICAPGYVLFDDLDYGMGTSYAAPLTTGVVTLLMACRGSFRVNPARVKAVLMASVSLDSYNYTPGSSGYRRYGAGIIDAGRASDIAGTMDYSDGIMAANASYHAYDITLSAYSTARIALAFEKCIQNNIEYSLANLNLQIYNSSGVLLYSSSTSNNNVEIIEFVPTYYDTYTIRIVNSSPATYSSLTCDTQYSISWIQ